MKKLKQLLLILVLSLSLTSPAVIPAMGTTTVSARTRSNADDSGSPGACSHKTAERRHARGQSC